MRLRAPGRNTIGMGTVELAISAIAMVIMVVLAIDLSIVMLGNQVLDRSARDACRAAAAQGTSANAINAAKAALALHHTDGFFVTQPTLSSTTSPAFVYNDFSGTPYGQVIPPGSPNAGTVAGNATVTVTTTVKVRIPAPVPAFGLSGQMDFVRTYTFPIVRQSLNKTYG